GWAAFACAWARPGMTSAVTPADSSQYFLDMKDPPRNFVGLFCPEANVHGNLTPAETPRFPAGFRGFMANPQQKSCKVKRAFWLAVTERRAFPSRQPRWRQQANGAGTGPRRRFSAFQREIRPISGPAPSASGG